MSIQLLYSIRSWYNATEWFRTLLDSGVSTVFLSSLPGFAIFYAIYYTITTLIVVFVLGFSWWQIRKLKLGDRVKMIGNWIASAVPENLRIPRTVKQIYWLIIRPLVFAAQSISTWLVRSEVVGTAKEMRREELNARNQYRIEKWFGYLANSLLRAASLGQADAAYRDWWFVRYPREMLMSFLDFIARLDKTQYAVYQTDIQDMRDTAAFVQTMYNERWKKLGHDSDQTVNPGHVWELLLMPTQYRKFARKLMEWFGDPDKTRGILNDDWVTKPIQYAKEAMGNRKTVPLTEDQLRMVLRLVAKGQNPSLAIQQARSQLDPQQREFALAMLEARDGVDLNEAFVVARGSDRDNGEGNVVRLVKVGLQPAEAARVVGESTPHQVIVAEKLIGRGIAYERYYKMPQFENDDTLNLTVRLLDGRSPKAENFDIVFDLVSNGQLKGDSALTKLEDEELRCLTLENVAALLSHPEIHESIVESISKIACRERAKGGALSQQDLTLLMQMNSLQLQLLLLLATDNQKEDLTTLILSVPAREFEIAGLITDMKRSQGNAKTRLAGKWMSSKRCLRTDCKEWELGPAILQSFNLNEGSIVGRPPQDIVRVIVNEAKEGKLNIAQYVKALNSKIDFITKECSAIHSLPLDRFEYPQLVTKHRLIRYLDLKARQYESLLEMVPIVEYIATTYKSGLETDKVETLTAEWKRKLGDLVANFIQLQERLRKCSAQGEFASCMFPYESAPCQRKQADEIKIPTKAASTLGLVIDKDIDKIRTELVKTYQFAPLLTDALLNLTKDDLLRTAIVRALKTKKPPNVAAGWRGWGGWSDISTESEYWINRWNAMSSDELSAESEILYSLPWSSFRGNNLVSQGISYVYAVRFLELLNKYKRTAKDRSIEDIYEQRLLQCKTQNLKCFAAPIAITK